MTLEDRILILFVMVAVPLILIGVPLFFIFGGHKTFALKPLLRCFQGINTHESRQPGDVEVVYHTYRGFFLWVVQNEHRVFASPDDARTLLSRLLRFNLTWGMLSYGLLFIPILASANYYAQNRSINRQERMIIENASSDV